LSRSSGLESRPGILRRAPLYLALGVFYLMGFLWCLGGRRARDMNDVLRDFYYGFLRLREEHVTVERISGYELVTVSRNPCPILRLSLILRVDTGYSCRLVSEPVCRYVLRRMNPQLRFERDYSYIRPYADGCRERITLGAGDRPGGRPSRP